MNGPLVARWLRLIKFCKVLLLLLIKSKKGQLNCKWSFHLCISESVNNDVEIEYTEAKTEAIPIKGNQSVLIEETPGNTLSLITE